jgi:hypothetical protein
VELFQRIEALIQRKMDAFPCREDHVLMLSERVSEAQRIAALVRGLPVPARILASHRLMGAACTGNERVGLQAAVQGRGG